MIRCFIAINLDEEIKKEILKIQNCLPDFSGKITELENLHLTLKFLGEIGDDKLKKIEKKLNEVCFERFSVNLNKIGFFSEKILRIIWMGAGEKDKGLFNLQKIIDDKMSEIGFLREERFMGHLTIARVKNVEDKKIFLQKLKEIKINSLEFDVDKFFLMKSELKSNRPIYTIIREFNLK